MRVTLGGTIPETSVIKINNENQLISANLNEIMNGSVIFNQSTQKFIVHYGFDKNAEEYKFTPEGMKIIGKLR